MSDAMKALLFAGATLGHVALLIRIHNWFYGSGLGRRAVDVMHLIHGLLALAGPILFWNVAGLDLASLFSADDPGRLLLAGYVAVCWLTGFVLAPTITIARLVHRCSALLGEETRPLCLETLAGRSLAGSKHPWLARLPFNEVCRLDLIVKTLRLEALPPEWDGLTILHLSDLHFCGTPDREYHERALELCMAWEPDIVALTGDYVDSLDHHAWLEMLGKLRAKEVKLAILGNHDYWYEPEEVRWKLHEMGCHTPRNSWETVTVRGRPMVVIGHEGPWLKPAPDLSGCPKDVFRLCLSHTPDNMRWAKANGIDLMLSGHVHGGQIRLPIVGSLLVPSRRGRRYDCGTFLEGRTLLHVSRGLSGKHPLRFNCRPEATLLVLRCR